MFLGYTTFTREQYGNRLHSCEELQMWLKKKAILSIHYSLLYPVRAYITLIWVTLNLKCQWSIGKGHSQVRTREDKNGKKIQRSTSLYHQFTYQSAVARNTAFLEYIFKVLTSIKILITPKQVFESLLKVDSPMGNPYWDWITLLLRIIK